MVGGWKRSTHYLRNLPLLVASHGKPLSKIPSKIVKWAKKENLVRIVNGRLYVRPEVLRNPEELEDLVTLANHSLIFDDLVDFEITRNNAMGRRYYIGLKELEAQGLIARIECQVKRGKAVVLVKPVLRTQYAKALRPLAELLNQGAPIEEIIKELEQMKIQGRLPDKEEALVKAYDELIKAWCWRA